MFIKKIAIIGLGMIGASIAAAAKQHALCETVMAYDIDAEGLEYARDQKWIDGYEDSIGAVVRNADLIIVATPADQCDAVFREIAVHMTARQVITDVCSVKDAAVQDARTAFGERIRQFVPGHPIAGSEKSGARAAVKGLFEGQRVILTPIPGVDQDSAVSYVTEFWCGLDAQVFCLNPSEHDRILALTSHLPHATAFAYLCMLSGHTNVAELHRYIGGGYRDSARLGASDLSMWRSIFFANKGNVVASIDDMIKQLTRLRTAIAEGNSGEVEAMIQIANQAHSAISSNQSVKGP